MINLGQKATAAAAELRNNEHFIAFAEGLGEVVQKTIMSALNAAPEMRLHATSYANGMHDIWNATEAARLSVKPQMVKPLKVPAVQPAKEPN